MARFTADLTEVFWTDKDPESARDHFSDPDAIAANYGGLASWDKLGNGGVKFVLPKKNHGVATFEGRYTCVWTPDSKTGLSWTTPDDPETNLWSSGKALFTREGGRTRVDYEQHTAIELNVGRILAKALNPVVREMTKRELRAYVERMLATIP